VSEKEKRIKSVRFDSGDDEPLGPTSDISSSRGKFSRSLMGVLALTTAFVTGCPSSDEITCADYAYQPDFTQEGRKDI